MIALIIVIVLFAAFLAVILMTVLQEKKEVSKLIDVISASQKRVSSYMDNDEYDFGHDVKIVDIDVEE